MFDIRFSDEARADLLRLFDALLERELGSATGDLTLPGRAIDAIEAALGLLRHSPFSCRKAGDGGDPLLRELIIDFGRTGYVALFKIQNRQCVVILAVRHQLEDDFH
jgi:plasmid stabilization system protein ParE